MADKIEYFPFVYENKSFNMIENLSEGGKKHVVPFLQQMILHLGVDRLQEMVLELKFEKKI